MEDSGYDFCYMSLCSKPSSKKKVNAQESICGLIVFIAHNYKNEKGLLRLLVRSVSGLSSKNFMKNVETLGCLFLTYRFIGWNANHVVNTDQLKFMIVNLKESNNSFVKSLKKFLTKSNQRRERGITIQLEFLMWEY